MNQNDNKYYERILSEDRIDCQMGSGEIISILYKDFILKSILECDNEFILKLKLEIENRSSLHKGPSALILNKFKEFYGMEPNIFIDEETEIYNFNSQLLDWRLFLGSYNYLKDSSSIEKKSQHTKKTEIGSRKIHYSKFKTTSLFFSSGSHVIEIFENDVLSLTTPSSKTYNYDIVSTQQDQNDMVIFLKNPQSGSIGFFKLMPLGRAELKFDIGHLLKLKI
ncbi:MAG: hypothetical protein HYZ42_03085 [Bacteroidetes bacterium]|nr:hypothetical protein [Bacteroidota bacterium]